MPLLNRPIAVLAVSIAIVAAGIWSAANTPLEWAPQLELPEVGIRASWPGASPRAVERYITSPIERTVQSIPGTEHVQSYSEEGVATITLQVSDSTPLSVYVAQVNERLGILRKSLPDRVVPRLSKKVPDALKDERGFMEVQAVGTQNPDILRTIVEESITPRLQSIVGIGEIEILGGTHLELLVEPASSKLELYGVSINDIRITLADLFTDDAYGRLRSDGEAQLLLRWRETELSKIADAPVRTTSGQLIRLKDVATITLSPAPTRSISRVDGNSVVNMRIDRARGSHLIEVAEQIHERLAEMDAEFGDEIRFIILDDKSEEVRDQLADLRIRGGIGLILVILVLVFMLKSVRAVALVALSTAVAFGIAFLLMRPLGLTFNLLTIAGLVLVCGLIVDASIVIIEQIAARKTVSKSFHTVCSDALKTVFLPLVGGTLTTVAVIIPLVYLSGDLRKIFLPFAVLTAITVLASLASAGLVIPPLSRWLPHRATHSWRRGRTWAAIPYKAVSKFPKLTLVLLVLLIGIPTWLLPNQITIDTDSPRPQQRLSQLYNETVGSTGIRSLRDKIDPIVGGVSRRFFKNVDYGQRWNRQPNDQVRVSLSFPPGNTVDRSDTVIKNFEAFALADESVSRTVVTVREQSAYMRVEFLEGALSKPEPYVLREKLIREAVQLAGIRVSVSGLLPEGYFGGIGGGISGFVVQAWGPNYDDLQSMCERFAERLKAGSRRVAGVDLSASRYGFFTESRQLLQFDWRADNHAYSGVSSAGVASILRPMLSTRFPSFHTQIDDQPLVPVRIAIADAEKTDVETLINTPIHAGDSTTFSLSSYVIKETPSAIEREDQQYKRYMRVDYRGPSRLGNQYLDRALSTFAVSPGYRLEKRQFSFVTEEVARSLFWMLAGTAFIVFLVTASVFESWRLPWLVLVSVPLAGIGVGLGFLWTESVFAEGAFIGLILLVGIAVNDSILLVDRYRAVRSLRPTIENAVAIRLAVRNRLRPMWTTTLTTIVAMLPLLLFPDQSNFWTGLSVTVVGGLFASTLLIPAAIVALVSCSRPQLRLQPSETSHPPYP